MALRPGTNVGPYRIDAPLGAGGMGEVYRAWDTRLKRAVALKVISSGTAMNAEQLARFEREARAVASLSHPNVLAVHDLGTVEDTPYVVFELLEGETLKERLARGALPVRKVVELGIQVCRGLAAGHARGIVHRDVKPANLFLTSDGTVKILDFGLARDTAVAEADLGEADTPSFTVAGVMLGTPAYMSPEQVRGQSVDARSDLFSLGATLYEMLAGKRAFDGATAADLLTAVLTKDPAEMGTPGAVPPSLERVVRRCLEKDPEERFQSARDVSFALDAVSGTTPSVAIPGGPGLPQRRRWTRGALAGVGLVVAAALGLVAGHRLWERPLPKITQLTFRRGMVDVARWTADGQTVVYSALWDGRPPEVFTLRVESPESRSLGLPPARLMSVSSRGELAILLVRPDVGGLQDAGTLARVPLAGGTPRAILEDVVAADWSPDGQDLAVLRRVDGQNQLEYPIGKVLDRTVGGFVRVSPRGDRVAVGSLDKIAVYDRAGTKTDIQTPRTFGLAWASDDALWMSGGELFRERSLWLAGLTGATREVYRGVGTLAFQDASRDGRLLLHRGYERIAIRVKPPGRVTEQEIAVSNMHMVTDLSADGRQLLFCTYGARADAAYLWSVDGGPPLRLHEGFGVALSPGARSAVIRPATPIRDAVPLSLTPTGPGATRTLLPGRFESATAWFLDEGHLVIDGNEPGRPSRAFVVDLAGGEPRPVTPEGTVSIRHSARDGYLLGRADDGRLTRYPIEGGAPQPLNARVPPDRTVLRASADGRFLLVFRRGLPRPVDRLDLATGSLEPFKLLQPDDLAGVGYITRGVLSANGEAYAYDYGRFLQDLYLVEGLR